MAPKVVRPLSASLPGKPDEGRCTQQLDNFEGKVEEAIRHELFDLSL